MPYIIKVRELEEVLMEREYVVDTEDLWEARSKVEAGRGAKTISSRKIKRTFKDDYIIECRKVESGIQNTSRTENPDLDADI